MYSQAILIACMLGLTHSTSVVPTTDMLNFTLYYESYNPRSIKFIVEQLYPTWLMYGNYIQLDLVPYGLTEQSYYDDRYHFKCSKGPEECFGNQLHACAIFQACSERTKYCAVPKVTKALSYIACVSNHTDQDLASDQCAREAGLNHTLVRSCAKSSFGEYLHSFYGNETARFKDPVVKYVPFMVFQEVFHSLFIDILAGMYFPAVVCQFTKEGCFSSNNRNTSAIKL